MMRCMEAFIPRSVELSPKYSAMRKQDLMIMFLGIMEPNFVADAMLVSVASREEADGKHSALIRRDNPA
jgi:hypothetical protein